MLTAGNTLFSKKKNKSKFSIIKTRGLSIDYRYTCIIYFVQTSKEKRSKT